MRTLARAGLFGAAVFVMAAVALPYIDALAFIARAANMQGAASTLAEWRSEPFVADHVRQIPTRHGPVDARIYRPANRSSRRAVTLVPGVHMDGIREARLVGMAEDLAASGFTVLTVASPDLQRFRITPESTDIIEDAAAWLADGAEGAVPIADDGKIGMLGISFSGGLSIVAAGRERLRDKVSYVMSFGGHGDLQRVMRYLASGNAPTMPPLGEATNDVAGAEHVTIRPPHDYGVAVVLLGVADELVPAEQVTPLRDGILTFLLASSLDMIDKSRAETEFARARGFEATLPEPARTLMAHVNNRAVERLGPILSPVVDSLAEREEHSALSPERATPPAANVYLLHGADDNVIPSVETVLLTNYLRDKTDVHAVLTALVTHAEVDRSAGAIEVWRLVGFWKSLMGQ
jgi:dienelactone hydrolase